MFDFSNEQQSTGSQYLRTPGLHQEALFTELVYEANENNEWYDLKFDVGGAIFSDRTFGTTLEKALVKQVYENKVARTESSEEAYKRTYKELFFKLLYLVSCFVDEKEAKEELGKFSSLKDLVDKANGLLNTADKTTKLNILTGWKNRDAAQKSNLIIPERIQWVEVTQYDAEGKIKPATIKMSKWQLDNMMVEKFPYGASNESTGTDNTILNDIAGDSSSLPF